MDGLFTDPAGHGELLDRYRAFAAPRTDRGGDWAATVRRAAYKVLTHELAAETDRLTRVAHRLCVASPEPALRDRAPWALRTALRELLVRLEVYRPYASVDAASVVTEEAAAEARLAFAVPEEAGAVDVVRDLLLGRYGDGPEHVEFRTRFAQTASALRAKSVEDTAFYRYVPLLSATEVGGDPGRPALTPEEFHAYCARVQRDWPTTGTVVSTHDTKRSADVRAALAVLTQCPGRWADVLAEVTRTGDGVPDAQLAWAAWQTVFGLGPADGDRVRDALLKHVREAGMYTSWTEQEPSYEEAVARFVTAGPCGAPGERVTALRAALEPHVRANVLGTALTHLTMPGVPDLYQGTEREYLALVDPDNRRAVDFPPAGPAGDDRSGKTAVTRAALALRARRPAVSVSYTHRHPPAAATRPVDRRADTRTGVHRARPPGGPLHRAAGGAAGAGGDGGRGRGLSDGPPARLPVGRPARSRSQVRTGAAVPSQPWAAAAVTGAVTGRRRWAVRGGGRGVPAPGGPGLHER